MRARALLTVLFFSTAAAALAAEGGEDNEQEMVKRGDYQAAVVAYGEAARHTSNAALVAEYAYALALAGFADPALAQMDRAFILDADDREVLFYGSAVLGAMGLTEAARELARPAPSWLGSPPRIRPLSPARRSGEAATELATADYLMSQKRYVSAAVRFELLTRQYPEESLAWSGSAIALEKLGAYQAAARAVEKDLELNASDEESVRIGRAYLADLKSRPGLEEQRRAGSGLKGRYLIYMGGSYSSSEAVTLVNFNSRIGKFLTDRFDVALNLGYVSGYEQDDFNGLSAGLSGRLNGPLPGAPLHVTAGAKLAYDPGPEDNVSFILSPGLSWFVPGGSIDLYHDIAIQGPSEGTRTWSLGYTAYFGGATR